MCSQTKNGTEKIQQKKEMKIQVDENETGNFGTIKSDRMNNFVRRRAKSTHETLKAFGAGI